MRPAATIFVEAVPSIVSFLKTIVPAA